MSDLITQPAQVTELDSARLAVQDVADLRREAALADTTKQLTTTYRALADAAYDITRAMRRLGATVDEESLHQVPESNLDFRVSTLYLETHSGVRHTFLALQAFTRVGDTVTMEEFYHGGHDCQVGTPQVHTHFSMLSDLGLLVRTPGETDSWKASFIMTKLAWEVAKRLKGRAEDLKYKDCRK